MKKFLETAFFILPLLILIILIYILINGKSWVVKPLKISPSVTPQVIGKRVSNFNYLLYQFNDLARLKLVINKQKLNANELSESNKCEAAINGGFYDANSSPLGLVVIDSEEESPKVNSDLFNGYVWLSDLGSFGITNDLPALNLQLALQSGPLLYVNGIESNLRINNDKQARRSIIGLLNNNNIFFLIVFDPKSLYLGPKLANLPSVISQIGAQENITVIDAINLDGGTASSFKDPNNYLTEFKSIGSLFCFTRE